MELNSFKPGTQALTIIGLPEILFAKLDDPVELPVTTVEGAEDLTELLKLPLEELELLF